MKTNIFIPKRILPDRFDLIIESIQMRELIEINSLDDFSHSLEELREWAKSPGQHVPYNLLKMEQIHLFMIEINLRNSDERRLIIRHLTNLDLLEFLSRLDEELDWSKISEVMELKGVP